MSEKRFAVLIGNGTFPNEPQLPSLRCPGADVEGMRRILTDPARGGFDEVVALRDRPSHELRLRIHETLLAAGRDDLVLLYYSGHGKTNLQGNLFLTAADTTVRLLGATAVPLTAVHESIKESACRKIFIILDCCFSGSAREAFLKGGVDDQLQRVARGSGIFMMTASTADENAEEKSGDAYSLFTKHLIDGIDRGSADQDGDGFVTADELYSHVRRAVLAEKRAQEPTKFALDVQGDLIVAKSGREPRRERAGKLRALLLELAREDRIPDDVLTAAMRVVSLPADPRDAFTRQRDALLDQLHRKEIKAGEFIARWVTLAPEAAPPPLATAAPKATHASPPPTLTTPPPAKEPTEPTRPSEISTSTASPRSRARWWRMLASWSSVALVLGYSLYRFWPHGSVLPTRPGLVSVAPAVDFSPPAAAPANAAVPKPAMNTTDFEPGQRPLNTLNTAARADVANIRADTFVPAGAWGVKSPSGEPLAISFQSDRSVRLARPSGTVSGRWDHSTSTGEVVVTPQQGEVFSLFDFRPASGAGSWAATWQSHADQRTTEVVLTPITAGGAESDALKRIREMGK